jgi:hypothetical protein
MPTTRAKSTRELANELMAIDHACELASPDFADTDSEQSAVILTPSSSVDGEVTSGEDVSTSNDNLPASDTTSVTAEQEVSGHAKPLPTRSRRTKAQVSVTKPDSSINVTVTKSKKGTMQELESIFDPADELPATSPSKRARSAEGEKKLANDILEQN